MSPSNGAGPMGLVAIPLVIDGLALSLFAIIDLFLLLVYFLSQYYVLFFLS